MRIGHGYDVHGFGPGDAVVVGGVSIPHRCGVKAHSDGDVLIHALCDALLGALGLGDIGGRFPDTDPRFAGGDSRVFLRDVMGTVHESGWSVANVDATVITQVPKLAPHVPLMRARLAADMAILPDCVNVKATTTETLGYIGREEGLAAHAVVLLQTTVSGV